MMRYTVIAALEFDVPATLVSAKQRERFANSTIMAVLDAAPEINKRIPQHDTKLVRGSALKILEHPLSFIRRWLFVRI